jgi:hypothetical protein
MAFAEVHFVIERQLALLSFQVRRSARQVEELLDPELREIGSGPVLDALGDRGCSCRRPLWR